MWDVDLEACPIRHCFSLSFSLSLLQPNTFPTGLPKLKVGPLTYLPLASPLIQLFSILVLSSKQNEALIRTYHSLNNTSPLIQHLFLFPSHTLSISYSQVQIRSLSLIPASQHPHPTLSRIWSVWQKIERLILSRKIIPNPDLFIRSSHVNEYHFFESIKVTCT